MHRPSGPLRRPRRGSRAERRRPPKEVGGRWQRGSLRGRLLLGVRRLDLGLRRLRRGGQRGRDRLQAVVQLPSCSSVTAFAPDRLDRADGSTSAAARAAAAPASCSAATSALICSMSAIIFSSRSVRGQNCMYLARRDLRYSSTDSSLIVRWSDASGPPLALCAQSVSWPEPNGVACASARRGRQAAPTVSRAAVSEP